MTIELIGIIALALGLVSMYLPPSFIVNVFLLLDAVGSCGCVGPGGSRRNQPAARPSSAWISQP